MFGGPVRRLCRIFDTRLDPDRVSTLDWAHVGRAELSTTHPKSQKVVIDIPSLDQHSSPHHSIACLVSLLGGPKGTSFWNCACTTKEQENMVRGCQIRKRKDGAALLCGKRLRWIHQRASLEATPKITLALLLVCCFGSVVRSQQSNSESATIRGTVFVRDSAGKQSVVPGAKVRLAGSASPETQTDENGEYEIKAVPFGTYTVEAALTGFNVVETIRVDGNEFRQDLDLKPAEVRTSVVVTADQAESNSPASSETISDKTLRDAPSVDERFESSLPLI